MNKYNNEYNPAEIEPRWREFWDKHEIYKTASPDSKKPGYYVLDMFPYPSGAGLHVGHPRGYIASDVYARYMRMQGYNVLHPMGFDSFGLPAEQYAIKTGNHPGPYTEELITHYTRQLSSLGFSFDWSRVIATHRPEYYKWTQWIFLQLYDAWFDAGLQKTRKISELVTLFTESGTANVSASGTHLLEFSSDEWNQKNEKEKQDILMNYRIAYEGFAEVNFCPELNTVLANDEVITNSKGEMVSERGEYPVIKKNMQQWFMRISAYGDRLLAGLDHIDWVSSSKEVQKNWIGKSEGYEFELDIFARDTKLDAVSIYTTRLDTFMGVTYIVLAPEHPFVAKHVHLCLNPEEINAYVEYVSKRSEDDRIAGKGEKTGTQFLGFYARHPLTGDALPVYISDFVLANYGTGAVMSVPAHDERDFEFAKKFNLPIKSVVEVFDINTGPYGDAFRSDKETIDRENVVVIIKHPKNDEYLIADWKQVTWRGFLTGGIEEGATIEETVFTEIAEETGYCNIDKSSLKIFNAKSHGLFYHVHKDVNRRAHYQIVTVTLSDLENKGRSEEEVLIADFKWVPADKIRNLLTRADMRFAWDIAQSNSDICYTEEGILSVDNEEHSYVTSKDAKVYISKLINARHVIRFRMRDAIFARQRYWGEPMPIIHKVDGTMSPIETLSLPLLLPNLTEFTSGEGGKAPLATNKEWTDAGYEVNTMPGWAASSWYFYRYMDPDNTHEFASKEAIEYFGNVDLYVGGTEHLTGHLLYSRFWNKALFDLGYVTHGEPFKKIKHQGMILGPDGQKMSKRYGNIVNPDDMIDQFGADALRLYTMFIAPFDAYTPWSTDGVVGTRRFLEKLWKKITEVSKGSENSNDNIDIAIERITHDITDFKFNTIVSTLMIMLRDIGDRPLSEADISRIARLLAPFAPFIAEEIWQNVLGEKDSVHVALWPEFKKIVSDSIVLGIQINGKVRGEISVGNDEESEMVKARVLALDEIKKYTENIEIKKFIYVKGKIISIVI